MGRLQVEIGAIRGSVYSQRMDEVEGRMMDGRDGRIVCDSRWRCVVIRRVRRVQSWWLSLVGRVVEHRFQIHGGHSWTRTEDGVTHFLVEKLREGRVTVAHGGLDRSVSAASSHRHRHGSSAVLDLEEPETRGT